MALGWWRVIYQKFKGGVSCGADRCGADEIGADFSLEEE